ncbi:MAG: high-affinity branched-chain amino acid ABC transporter ATP-binding protein LivG [Firmicutes bacterium HGW-Firmicutes-14]|nr:MAG: high-affinity branched-chain amino acid ABC transporter ATP-binding protein LivG [Firmicutes bacterium HGW-Firmicutes-14]
MKLLEISGLTKSFGGVVAVNDLSFSLEKGQIMAIIGPNGAGKTTLFNLITGVYPPTKGSIVFNGRDATGLPAHRIATLGIARTFQNLQIFNNMTVLENVMVGQHTRSTTGLMGAVFPMGPVQREERKVVENSLEKLAMVGLADKAMESAPNLPYGRQKMLEIARAAALEPELLLLDEPAAGLNSTETRELVNIIYELRDRGITILLVEHDMETVMEIADQIVVLNFGNKLAEGTPFEIQNNQEVISAYLGEEEF